MDHLERQGTVRHLTVHDSPQSNGRIEQANRTHLQNARAMLIQANCLVSYGLKLSSIVFGYETVPTLAAYPNPKLLTK
jgi:hypothetical protein